MIEWVAIGILSVGNLITGAFLFNATRKEDPKKVLTTEAHELLSELMKGGAVIVTQVIDKNELFLWSPKGRG